MIETIRLKPALKWIHFLSPTENDLDFLQNNFHFHALDIDDCRSKTQRPKVDIYDDYNFIILHFPHFDNINSSLIIREVKIFWGREYLITIGNSHWVVKDMFDKMKVASPDEIANIESSDILLYKILERLMSETISILNVIANQLDDISFRLFNKKAEKIIEEISIARKNIILLDTIFKPQLRVFHKFESGDIKGFATHMEEYWGNILDYIQKIWDMVEDYNELIEGLSKTFDSLQANRTNEIIKVLTFFSSFMLPLTLITGIYGMNIHIPLQNHPYSLIFVFGFMVVVVIALLIFFRKRKWM